MGDGKLPKYEEVMSVLALSVSPALAPRVTRFQQGIFRLHARVARRREANERPPARKTPVFKTV